LFSSHFLLLAFFEKSHDWVFLEYQTFLKKIDPFQIPIQKTSSISFLCFQLKDTFLRFTFKPDIFYLKKIPSQMSILLVSELFNPKNSQPPQEGIYTILQTNHLATRLIQTCFVAKTTIPYKSPRFSYEKSLLEFNVQ